MAKSNVNSSKLTIWSGWNLHTIPLFPTQSNELSCYLAHSIEPIKWVVLFQPTIKWPTGSNESSYSDAWYWAPVFMTHTWSNCRWPKQKDNEDINSAQLCSDATIHHNGWLLSFLATETRLFHICCVIFLIMIAIFGLLFFSLRFGKHFHSHHCMIHLYQEGGHCWPQWCCCPC